MEPDRDATDEAEDPALYLWTIRILYAAALGLNVWMLWKASADDVELQIVRRRMGEAWKQLAAPARRAREWRKGVARMHWAALQTLEESNAESGD